MKHQDTQALIKEWAGEEVIIRFDQPTGAWIFIALHSTKLGPAAGGTRMKQYPDWQAALADVLRLSAGMTNKFAVAGFPRGGGKTVIALPTDFDPADRAGLLRRYGMLVRQLGGLYFTGPDVGTTAEDMDVIAELGAPYVHARSQLNGGAGSSGPATALGVFAAIEATCQQLYGTASLAGRRVIVQGTGSVGGTLLGLLASADAEVWFSEIEPGARSYFQHGLGLPCIPTEEAYDMPCDIFAPCALGGVLNAQTIPRLQCRAVAGAANNQLETAADAERLHERGILYAPDFAINSGGAIAITGREALGWSPEHADSEVRHIGQTLARIYALAAAEGITTEAAARRLVTETLNG